MFKGGSCTLNVEKPEYPEKKLTEQSREPTNTTHIWHRIRESNPGHIGERRVLSPQSPPYQFSNFFTVLNLPYQFNSLHFPTYAAPQFLHKLNPLTRKIDKYPYKIMELKKNMSLTAKCLFLPLQCGRCEDHSPSWHVIERFPTKLYPSLHEKLTLALWGKCSCSPFLAPFWGIPGSLHISIRTESHRYPLSNNEQ